MYSTFWCYNPQVIYTAVEYPVVTSQSRELYPKPINTWLAKQKIMYPPKSSVLVLIPSFSIPHVLCAR